MTVQPILKQAMGKLSQGRFDRLFRYPFDASDIQPPHSDLIPSADEAVAEASPEIPNIDLRTPLSASPAAQLEFVQPPISPVSLEDRQDGSDMDAEGEVDVDNDR